MRTIPVLFLSLIVAAAAETKPAAPAAPVVLPTAEALIAQHTHVFAYTATGLSGPGAEFLRAATARSQFVLLGEEHMDHEIPAFAGGLYTMLHEAHGFRHLVVEQDPVAIEDVLLPAVRGDAGRIAALAKRFPSLFEFDSDEDLTLLADIGRLENSPDAIWGVEQATGAARYLEELAGLAPNPGARRQAETLLEAARAADPGPNYSVNWLAGRGTPDASTAVAALTAAFQSPPDSRSARLLGALAKSAEIFGYYTRAEAGEYVGLYNNTVREEVLKENFLRRYRAALKSRGRGARSAEPATENPEAALPKALFKFGSNHLYHGKNPTQAFPIGNLAHELAIVNGMEAYGLFVLPLGANYSAYKDFPAWLLPLLPASEPMVPTLIDLRELRRFQRLFREKVAPADGWEQRAVLHGYDAIVLLPGSKPSVKALGGRDATK